MSATEHVEWGVLWPEENEVEDVDSRETAEMVARLNPVGDPKVVSRIVVVGEWVPA